MSKTHEERNDMYSNIMETLLSIHNRIKDVNHGGKTVWVNVLNVQLKFQNQKRPGKWQADQTNKEKECNLKSAYTNAQNAATYSEKY